MTAVICWERRVGPLTELVFASDSRVTGGEVWDACPKLFNIGRSDVVMAFAGYTARAYPFTLQALATVSSYRASQRRSLDVTALVGHVRRSMDSMLLELRDTPETVPDCQFILGGWSWRTISFRAYKLFFERTAKRFTASPLRRAEVDRRILCIAALRHDRRRWARSDSTTITT